MVMLSDFCFSKEMIELQSVGCGSAGCDARDLGSFGGPGKKWSVKLPVGPILGFPK